MVLEPLYDVYLIMRKDLTEFYRIKARLVAMIALPVVLMVLFGYMFPSGGTVTHIPIAVVEQDQSATGVSLAAKFMYAAQSSGMLDVVAFTDLSEAENQLTLGNIYAIVIFEQGVGQQSGSTGQV